MPHSIMPIPLRYLFLLFLTGLVLTKAGAQSHLLRGSVNDTVSNTRLYRATVMLIRAKDSTLAGFTRTDSTGSFSLQADSSGQYILLITYPNYADYSERVKLSGDLVLPSVSLTSRAHVLQEFVFKKKAAAIIIKGDTTEYTADSFALRNGANVEELLKKLPGLQVDQDGKITAQGEQVQKILVDGEEFFSDDPAVVTRNLQAATVDKVQVYDKKSDQASFTGIDDGEKTKTINLMLKEDKKKGLFGKAQAAGGPSLSPDQHSSFFENEAMINLFRGKRQISAFGIMSNTGTTGLSWGDRDKYGGGNNFEYDEESGNMYSYYEESGDDIAGSWDGRYNGQGLPTVWTGGLHYADKWAKDAQHISANYRFSKSNIDADGSNTTQYILPDSQYVRHETHSTFNTGKRHGGDGLYEWTIDTSSNIKLTVGGDYSERSSSGVYASDTRGASGALINTNARSTSNTATSQSVNAALVYRKKFAKKGRNMSAELRLNNKSNDGSGYVVSSSNYYKSDSLIGTENVDQRKTNSANTFSLNAQLSYTEPISKVSFLTLRYGARATNSRSERFSFNKAGSDWSATPDSVYSSSYGYDILTQNGAASLRFVFKKYNFAFGGEVFHTSWQQRDRFAHINDRSRDYNNFSPTASLKYSFNKQSTISFNYSGRTNQPTIDQLQPLKQNTDPLNISIGNPDLRQEFSNNFGLSYHSYKPLSGRYIYISANGGFTQDDITRAEFFDERGGHTYQYINVNGNWNAWMWGGYNFRVKKLDMSFGIQGNINSSHTNTFINGLRNTSNNSEYNIGLNVEKSWKKGDKDVASISLYPHVAYHDNSSSISNYATPYWTSNINADLFVELPWKIQLRSEAWYDYRQQTVVFNTNNNVVRWNASLGRKFLKGDKLELRVSVADILNQNLGYNRNAQANYISEDRYTTIRRHALISLTYLFSGGTGTVKNDDDDDD
jgi:hypothetical protein